MSITKPFKCPVLKQLIRERRQCNDQGQRAALSKRMFSKTTQAMRKLRTEWQFLLLKLFVNLAELSRINSALKASPSCPIDPADIANFFRDMFSSDHIDYVVLPKN